MTLTEFNLFLQTLKSYPVLGASISKTQYISIDLSVNNPQLQTTDVSSSKSLETYIWSHIKKHNAKVAFGGYLEPRGIYQRSNYFNTANSAEERNIHLGLDLWIEAYTPIYAPLDGTIHSYKNNTNYGDYGPTIILEHKIESTVFYTLYGHLSLESLNGKAIGVEVKKGEQIATLGTAEVNGDYAPHLHFQIIRDLEKNSGDYPGVCNSLNLDFYKNNCPDPNLLLKLN